MVQWCYTTYVQWQYDRNILTQNSVLSVLVTFLLLILSQELKKVVSPELQVIQNEL